jgi:hypothetical protein
LVVPARVEVEFAEQFAGVSVDDADVEVGDESEDVFPAVFAAQADVAQSAVVAQRDHAAGVDLVAADPVVDGDRGLCWTGFRAGVEGLLGGAATDGAVRSDAVVVVAEPVELALQLGQGAGWSLGGEPLLLGLVEPLDAPMFVKPQFRVPLVLLEDVAGWSRSLGRCSA